MLSKEFLTKSDKLVERLAILQDKTKEEVESLSVIKGLLAEVRAGAVDVEAIQKKAYEDGRADEAAKAYEERQLADAAKKAKAAKAKELAEEIPVGMEVD